MNKRFNFSVQAIPKRNDIPPQGTLRYEVNNNLEDSPDLVNSDAYGDGWIVKISDYIQDELENLLNADQYIELIK